MPAQSTYTRWQKVEINKIGLLFQTARGPVLGERDLDEDDPLALEISGLNRMEKGLMKLIKGAEDILSGVQMQKRGVTLFREQY